MSAINLCPCLLPLSKGKVAGAEGFEPPLAVLETAGLPLNLRPSILRPYYRGIPILLDFLMRLVLPAMGTELLHFQALGSGLLVLGARIIPVLAFRALKRNDIARHSLSYPVPVGIRNRKKTGAVDQD